ncbi:MAG: hypothetical protein GY944_26570 [bacterium]|nr:hypothetical protein [bacterium]
MRNLLLSVGFATIGLVVGCASPDPIPPGELTAAQIATQDAEIEALHPVVTAIEAAYLQHHQVEGVCFVARMPLGGALPRYASDADNAIFTGIRLAAASYRYGVTGAVEDLEAVQSALEGVHLLSHAAPIPGVLARVVFPREDAWSRFGYGPEGLLAPHNQWRRRMQSGQVYEHAGRVFYTRTTRDQLTGIVFGLAVTHHVVASPSVRERVASVVRDLVGRLEHAGWSLVDHTAMTGTDATGSTLLCASPSRPSTTLRL